LQAAAEEEKLVRATSGKEQREKTQPERERIRETLLPCSQRRKRKKESNFVSFGSPQSEDGI